jgi:hypothetical protein
MRSDLFMEIGKKVKVFTPNMSHYPLVGEVIKEGIDLNGMVMSKVRFSKYNEAWYADQNLKPDEIEFPEKILH